MISRRGSQQPVKIGGVYSADGHIVVQEDKGSRFLPIKTKRGGGNGPKNVDPYTYLQQQQHHHHHHKKQMPSAANQFRAHTGCYNGNHTHAHVRHHPSFGKDNKELDGHHHSQLWKGTDPRLESATFAAVQQKINGRRPELIPRAKLRQRGPDYACSQQRLRHCMSFCRSRQGTQEIDRTRSDAGHHYSRPTRFIEDKHKREEQFNRQPFQLPAPPEESPPEVPPKKNAASAQPPPGEGSQCTLKRSKDTNNSQHNNMEIYAASTIAVVELKNQQETESVQRQPNQEAKSESSSNESGFDERRDSSSSQEHLPRINPEELYEKVNKKPKTKKLPLQEEVIYTTSEVVRDLPETYVQAPQQITKDSTPQRAETLTLVSDRKLTTSELNNEINKFMAGSNNLMNGDQTYYEEEYSYEPESNQSSSKLVLRTRSLMNLSDDYKSGPGVVRPVGMRTKITTGPDGGFVIGGRKANSEMNLSDESNETSPKCGRLFAGDELKKRREEIIKKITAPWPPQDSSKFFEEINQGNERTTKEIAISSLKKYLSDNKIALKELLTNRNVVIVEPFRTSKEIDLSEYNHRNAKFEGCRITGAISKDDLANNNEASNTLPRATKLHQASVQRHYFYHLIKSKTDPKEEDLPDPDKVRNTRERFQKEIKLVGPEEQEVKDIMLPIAAKIITPHKENLNRPKITPEVRVIYDTKRKESPDLKKTKKWTDSGSLSSGVSSDMSCIENELDNILDEEYSSDEEEETTENQDLKEIHPISPEVMKKIRACGTTVTYYGGRIISHSYGPSVRSPMTMTIMDEIKQGYEMPRKIKDNRVGIKFRLVKSNSCGSRLELAGTDDEHRMREEGKTLSEELAECRERMEPIEDLDEHEDESTNTRRVLPQERKTALESKKPSKASDDKQLSWRALIESRKQNKAMELRRIHIDMEFEEFQVAE